MSNEKITAAQAVTVADGLLSAVQGLEAAKVEAAGRVKTATVDAIAAVLATAKAVGVMVTEADYMASVHAVFQPKVAAYAAANGFSAKSLEKVAYCAKWLFIAGTAEMPPIPEADSRDWQKAGAFARVHADTVPGLALKAKGAAGGRPGKPKDDAAKGAAAKDAPAPVAITEPHPVDAVMTLEKATASLFPGEAWTEEAAAFLWLFQNNHRKTVGNAVKALYNKYKPKTGK